MSFLADIQNADKVQLMEVVKGGVRYLMLFSAKEAARALKRFQEGGAISLKDGTILWQGTGKMPQDLREALDKAGFAANA